MAQVRNYWDYVSVVFFISSRDITTGHFGLSKKMERKSRRVEGHPKVVRCVTPQRVMAWCIITCFQLTSWLLPTRINFAGSNPGGKEGCWVVL